MYINKKKKKKKKKKALKEWNEVRPNRRSVCVSKYIFFGHDLFKGAPVAQPVKHRTFDLNDAGLNPSMARPIYSLEYGTPIMLDMKLK